MKTLVCILGLVLLSTGPTAAAAETDPVVSKADKRGDVHLTAEKGLNARQRRSVDLRRLTITKTADGPRVQLRVKRVVIDGSFDQYFFVYFDADGYPFGYLKIKASTLRGKAELEGADTPDGFASCRVDVSLSSRQRKLEIDVPNRCVPTGPASLFALAYTTPLGKDGGSRVYSRDTMSVRQPVTIKD